MPKGNLVTPLQITTVSGCNNKNPTFPSSQAIKKSVFFFADSGYSINNVFATYPGLIPDVVAYIPVSLNYSESYIPTKKEI